MSRNPQRGNTWIVCEYQGSQRVSTKTFPAAEQGRAEAYLAHLVAKRAVESAGKGGPLAGSGPLLGRDVLLNWWQAARPSKKPSVQRLNDSHIRKHLIPYFGDMDVRLLADEDITGFAVDRVRVGKLGVHSVQTCASILRRALKWCIAKKYLDRMPVEGLCLLAKQTAAKNGAKLGEREAFTHGEIAHLLAQAEPQPHLYDLVYVAHQAAPRKGELVDLRWTDVNLDAGTIRVSRSRDRYASDLIALGSGTKTGKSRLIEMSPGLQAFLLILIKRQALQRKNPGNHVLLDRKGNPWNQETLNSAWSRLVERAHKKHGVRPLPLHCLRHTWASWAIDSGARVTWIANQLGHSVETLLRTYSHFFERKQAGSHDFLSLDGGAAQARPSSAQSDRADRVAAARSAVAPEPR